MTPNQIRPVFGPYYEPNTACTTKSIHQTRPTYLQVITRRAPRNARSQQRRVAARTTLADQQLRAVE